MEQALVALMLADAGITALVSTRIQWVFGPQASTSPYIVMSRVSGVRDYSYQGPTTFIESRVQIDCWGLTYASTKEVARACETKLSGYRGIQGTTDFKGMFLENERDGFEDDQTPTRHFRVSLDFMILHKGV